MQTMKTPVIENNDLGIYGQQNIQSDAMHRVIDMVRREGREGWGREEITRLTRK
jgi:hypothetical protein